MQGTERNALKQLERNKKSFEYPKDGFEQKIEFSLLYAMLAEPDTYPKQVVYSMVDDEDFEQYMHTNKEGQVSYAQLSAALAYAAEKNPPSAPSRTNNNNSKEDRHDGHEKKETCVSQKLCKKILQTVVRYAEENDLDRETELEELLSPVKKVAAQRAEKSELKSMIPFYIGYTAALLTANPLPLLIGTVGMASASSANDQEWRNMDAIMKETDRKADIERSGLLDEDEHS
jgi:hypothetical protein